MASKYITTSKGFLKSIIFDKELREHVVEYTDKIRYAQGYTTKSAKQVMLKYNIDGFIYSPHAEEPIRDKYQICQRKDTLEFRFEEEQVGGEEWIFYKVKMLHEDDVSFLNSGKLQSECYYSFEDARQKALELNMKTIENIQEQINKQLEPQFKEAREIRNKSN